MNSAAIWFAQLVSRHAQLTQGTFLSWFSKLRAPRQAASDAAAPVSTPSWAADDPSVLAAQALAQAYGDKPLPGSVHDLLRLPFEPAKVLALFFFGRSGSFFLQSFFDNPIHPQVLTVPPTAIVHFDDIVGQHEFDSFNQGGITFGDGKSVPNSLYHWVDSILRRFPDLCLPLVPGPSIVSVEILAKLMYAIFRFCPKGRMSYSTLFKTFLVARRLAAGEPIAAKRPLVHVWQAHTPSTARKRWVLDTFRDPHLLTIVRFPEKALDSHLIHHGFETIVTPRQRLFNHLCVEHLSQSADLAGDPESGRERVVRFEDLHHHTDFVLKAIWDWIGIAPRVIEPNQFSFNVRGRLVTGARRLTRGELESKLLNHVDRLKVRHLLQENYGAWNYGCFLAGGLQRSLDEYGKDDLSRMSAFGAHALLSQLSGGSSSEIAAETERLMAAVDAERRRRDDGIRLTPLLYDTINLPIEDRLEIAL